MHGIAKRGLALVAASSGLLLGSAAFAEAEQEQATTAHSAHSGGAATGSGVDRPAEADPGRAVAGDAVQAVSSGPLLFCGWDTAAVALDDPHTPSYCGSAAAGTSAGAPAGRPGASLIGGIVRSALNKPLAFGAAAAAGGPVGAEDPGPVRTG